MTVIRVVNVRVDATLENYSVVLWLRIGLAEALAKQHVQEPARGLISNLIQSRFKILTLEYGQCRRGICA
jgi:hypothetical protein